MENSIESNTNEFNVLGNNQSEAEVQEESTKVNLEDKIIDFQNKMDKIISLKNEGNSFFRTNNTDSAIEKYFEANGIIEDADKLFSEFLQIHKEKDENLQNLHSSFVKEKVAIFSNQALIYSKKENFEVSIEYDIKVILK